MNHDIKYAVGHSQQYLKAIALMDSKFFLKETDSRTSPFSLHITAYMATCLLNIPPTPKFKLLKTATTFTLTQSLSNVTMSQIIIH